MKIPAIINQGDTVTWTDASTHDNLGNAITSSDWALTWYFSGPTAPFQVVSTASGSGWQTTLTATQTAALTPGEAPPYFWQALATKGSTKITIGSGRLVVLATMAGQATGFDGRTQAEKDLAAVQAAMRARVSGGAVAEYMIGSRRLRNEPMSELIVMEDRLKRIVASERRAEMIANGLGDPRNSYVRFS